MSAASRTAAPGTAALGTAALGTGARGIVAPGPGPTVLGVCVPAHDEQQRLGACLRALARATARLTRAGGGVRVEVVVVLDDCSDGTGAVASATGVRTVTTRARNVGAARAAGMRALLRSRSTPTWLATTDADSRVPLDWLIAHAAAAGAGVDVLVGTVAVADWSGWSVATAVAHRARYAAGGDPHRHVHGANLGISAAAYRRLGGFAPLAVGEDHRLVAEAERAAMSVLRTRAVPVRTSARPQGRAPAGFSADLVGLDRAVGARRPVDGAA